MKGLMEFHVTDNTDTFVFGYVETHTGQLTFPKILVERDENDRPTFLSADQDVDRLEDQ